MQSSFRWLFLTFPQCEEQRGLRAARGDSAGTCSKSCHSIKHLYQKNGNLGPVSPQERHDVSSQYPSKPLFASVPRKPWRVKGDSRVYHWCLAGDLTKPWPAAELPGLPLFQTCILSSGPVSGILWRSFSGCFFPTKYFFLAMCSLIRTVCSYSIEYSKFPDATVVKQELPLLCLLCAAGWD